MTTRLPEQIYAGEIVIRLWAAADAEEMTDLIIDNLSHLRPWMAWAKNEPLSAPQRLRMFKRWDRYWAAGDGAIYSIRLAGQLVGGCALHRQPDGVGVEVGYWLGQEATGIGIATRAVSALRDAALALSDVEYFQISHESSNSDSAGVPGRLGFTRLASKPGSKVTSWRSTVHTADVG